MSLFAQKKVYYCAVYSFQTHKNHLENI